MANAAKNIDNGLYPLFDSGYNSPAFGDIAAGGTIFIRVGYFCLLTMAFAFRKIEIETIHPMKNHTVDDPDYQDDLYPMWYDAVLEYAEGDSSLGGEGDDDDKADDRNNDKASHYLY